MVQDTKSGDVYPCLTDGKGARRTRSNLIETVKVFIMLYNRIYFSLTLLSCRAYQPKVNMFGSFRVLNSGYVYDMIFSMRENADPS